MCLFIDYITFSLAHLKSGAPLVQLRLLEVAWRMEILSAAQCSQDAANSGLQPPMPQP